IMGIVLRDIDPARDNVGRADAVNAAALEHGRVWFDHAGVRIDPIARIDMAVIGAICQRKTKGGASHKRRKPLPCRACPTPHHPQSRGRNYRIRAWSDCGENSRMETGSNGPFQPSLCSGHTLWPCAMHEQCLSGRFTGDLKSGVRHAVLPSRLSRCCISGIGPRLSSPLTKKITASPPSEAEVVNPGEEKETPA